MASSSGDPAVCNSLLLLLSCRMSRSLNPSSLNICMFSIVRKMAILLIGVDVGCINLQQHCSASAVLSFLLEEAGHARSGCVTQHCISS